MGDVVKCKCVLKKNVDPTRMDYLFLSPAQGDYRDIPCRPKGQPRQGSAPQWEYEERDGQLFLTPSLLFTDTGFHTDYNWNVSYELCPEGVEKMDHFFAINPGIQP